MNSVILLIRDNIMKKKIERWSLGENETKKQCNLGPRQYGKKYFVKNQDYLSLHAQFILYNYIWYSEGCLVVVILRRFECHCACVVFPKLSDAFIWLGLISSWKHRFIHVYLSKLLCIFTSFS